MSGLYKTRDPLYSDVTPWISGRLSYTKANPDTSSFYKSSTKLNSTYFALNHHAYLYACEGGTWQFDITFVDDVVFGWVESATRRTPGWTDQNADAKAVWTYLGDNHYSSASFRQDLDGGSCKTQHVGTLYFLCLDTSTSLRVRAIDACGCLKTLVDPQSQIL
ncbi:hypothetical protein GGR54DRAFT_153344 [Hypoxylon sp. NC1633]|nr:hypothetical protein GGR54DRAFT_153344 [Hypoxylon sp. NC1633]